MKNQWLTAQSLQRGQRLAFSFFVGMFTWWYIHEHQMATRTFTDIPIYIRNIPPARTLLDLKKEGGRLNRHFTLTLKGRKRELEKLKENQIEVVIDAAGKGDIWKEQLTVADIRSLNPDISLSKVITSIHHSHLQIHLTNVSRREVPVTITPPHGSLPKGYSFLDTWPRNMSEVIEGPENAVRALASKHLYTSFDLRNLPTSELEKLTSISEGGEIFIPIPDEWKSVKLPPPFDEEHHLQNSEAEHLILVALKANRLKLNHALPIRISTLPYHSPSSKLKICFTPENMKKQGTHLVWNLPIFIDYVSQEFLLCISPQLELVLYVDQHENVTAKIELANLAVAKKKYISMMLNRLNKPNPETFKAYLSDHFWQYMRRMAFYHTETGQSLNFEFSIHNNELSIVNTPGKIDG